MHFLLVLDRGARKTTPMLLQGHDEGMVGSVANVLVLNKDASGRVVEQRMLTIEMVTVDEWDVLQSAITHQHNGVCCVECNRPS